jgi:hypothetical protein
MSSAYWLHFVVQDDSDGSVANGNTVALDVGDVYALPSSLCTDLVALWAAHIAGVAMTHSKTTGYFTISAAGVFTLDLDPELAAVLGLATALAGAATYTSTLRPSLWWGPEHPVGRVTPSFSWQRHAMALPGGTDYRAIVQSGYVERWTVYQPVTESERTAYRDWVLRALQLRRCTWWPSTSLDTTWAWTTAWRCHPDVTIVSADVALTRFDAAVRMLYNTVIELEEV